MKTSSIKRYIISLICMLLASIMLTGCISKPYLVKPSDGYAGNISIKSIEVSKVSGVKSDTIMAAVKAKLKEDARDLRGSKPVDMKVVLDYLTVPLPGGAMTAKLIGSNTMLKGTVSILDADQVVAKYNITAEHNEGGLLGKTMAISFVDTQNAVVNKFSQFAVYYLQ